MTGERWRLVTTQNGREHVSSIVVSREEAAELIQVEARLHRAAGWKVKEYGNLVVQARRGSTERLISAHAFSPHDDAQSDTV